MPTISSHSSNARSTCPWRPAAEMRALYVMMLPEMPAAFILSYTSCTSSQRRALLHVLMTVE
jgi:hypothetical protein